jgi:nitrogen fixation protein FixH
MSPAKKWTTAIVGLLAGNVIAMVILATVARIGHSEVIPDYYEKATRYDDVMAQRTTNDRLGWHVVTSIVRGELEVVVRDRFDHPVEGATIRATGLARAHASEHFERILDGRGPGRYGALADDRAGVHDVTLVIERAGLRFVEAAVVDAR